MTSSSSLGIGVASVSQLARRSSHLHPPPIVPSSDPGVWAPCPSLHRTRSGGWACSCQCVDAQQYHRRQHSLDSDRRCIFCGKQQ